jgi:kinetochore protein Mis13/DSN1
VPASTAKRGRKSKEPKPRDDEDQDVATAKKPKGRKMSFSTPRLGSDALNVPKGRKTTRSSIGKDDHAGQTSNIAGSKVDEDSIDMVGGDSVQGMNGSAEHSRNGTVIALPFSDTPIMNRNKEMRKKGGNGLRRSSLGLRGRRASSLIDNGHSAIPHREVESSDFYKHIEADLMEPRRMKQLLTWTGERCLVGEEKELGDPNRAAAKAGKIEYCILWRIIFNLP